MHLGHQRCSGVTFLRTDGQEKEAAGQGGKGGGRLQVGLIHGRLRWSKSSSDSWGGKQRVHRGYQVITHRCGSQSPRAEPASESPFKCDVTSWTCFPAGVRGTQSSRVRWKGRCFQWTGLEASPAGEAP